MMSVFGSPAPSGEQPSLHVEVITQSDRAVLRCVGEIDCSTVERLEEALLRAAGSGLPEVEVDLRDASYLNGAAIRALLRTRYRLSQEGRAFTVRARARTVRLFHALKLHWLLDIQLAEEHA